MIKKQPPKHQLEKTPAGEAVYNFKLRSITPGGIASALKAGEDGDLKTQFELFRTTILTDTHLLSELSKRQMRGAAKLWKLSPPRNPSQKEINNTDGLTENLLDINNLYKLFYNLLDATGKGFSACCIKWQNNGIIIPENFTYIDQSLFNYKKGAFKLLDKNNIEHDLWQFGWVVHSVNSICGYPSQGGLLNNLIWPYMFKQYSIDDLAEFLEVYGIPLRLGKYPAGAGELFREDLKKAVRSIGHSAAGIISDSCEIQFIEAAKGVSSDAFLNHVDYLDKVISRAILGGTLTSQSDGKSSTNALGNIHLETLNNIIRFDCRHLAETINTQIINPICTLNNLFAPGRYPRLSFILDTPEDQQAALEKLKTGAELGMKISVEDAHKMTGIPMAAEDADILGSKPEKTAAEMIAAADKKTDAASTSDRYTSQMSHRTGGAINSWITKAKNLAKNSQSLEQYRDSLIEIFYELDEKDFENVFSKGIQASHLAGIYESSKDEMK